MIILNRERGIFLNGNFSTIPETYSHIFVYKEINKISKKKWRLEVNHCSPWMGRPFLQSTSTFTSLGGQVSSRWSDNGLTRRIGGHRCLSVEFDGIDARMLHVHYNTIVMIHTYILHRCIFWVYVFDIYIYALYIWVCAYINIIHCTLFYT